MITSVIATVAVLGGLIFFHELGHFAVARIFGMGVKTFSLGFGRKLFGFTSGRTEYKLSLVPLGGYVALAGEQGEDEDDFPDEELFSNRPAWQRLCVVAAGPIANFVLAFILLWVIILAQGQGHLLPTVGAVMPDTPAASAGLQSGDLITSIDKTPISTWEELVITVRQAEHKELAVTIERDGTSQVLKMTPLIKTFKDLYGENVTVPVIGIQPGNNVFYTPVEGNGFIPALDRTWFEIVKVVKGFKSIILRLIPVEHVGGPIMLAQIIHQGAQSGFINLLYIAAVISINLAIINLLPIPVLDGGHIVFFTLEMIMRRPLNDKVKSIAMRVGLLLLLMLMALAVFNDVRRIILS